jgi:hypothetical protein
VRSGGEEGAADAEAVLPTLEFINKVFENVHTTIGLWCQPSRMGAAVTVLRNLAIASWYQVRGWCLYRIIGGRGPLLKPVV